MVIIIEGEGLLIDLLLSVYSPFSDRVGLPLYNIMSPFLPVMDVVAVAVDPHLHVCLEVSFHTLKCEVMGHPVPVSSLGFKCPACFIWNCSYVLSILQR